MLSNDYDKLFKIVIVGDAGVGKTNLLMRYTKGEFSENSRATIGVGFGHKDIEIDNKNIRLQIWDTAGQERFRATPSAYYRGAHGALIVFDLCDRESYDKITVLHGWIEELTKYSTQNSVKLLVGNKVDQASSCREVTTNEAHDFAVKNNMKYYETSAKNDLNVSTIFEDLANMIIIEQPIGVVEPPKINKQPIATTQRLPPPIPKPLNLAPQQQPPNTKCCK
jgi:small GTP-binding protein